MWPDGVGSRRKTASSLTDRSKRTAAFYDITSKDIQQSDGGFPASISGLSISLPTSGHCGRVRSSAVGFIEQEDSISCRIQPLWFDESSLVPMSNNQKVTNQEPKSCYCITKSKVRTFDNDDDVEQQVIRSASMFGQSPGSFTCELLFTNHAARPMMMSCKRPAKGLLLLAVIITSRSNRLYQRTCTDGLH